MREFRRRCVWKQKATRKFAVTLRSDLTKRVISGGPMRLWPHFMSFFCPGMHADRQFLFCISIFSSCSWVAKDNNEMTAEIIRILGNRTFRWAEKENRAMIATSESFNGRSLRNLWVVKNNSMISAKNPTREEFETSLRRSIEEECCWPLISSRECREGKLSWL